jgi:hypothetical protein
VNLLLKYYNYFLFYHRSFLPGEWMMYLWFATLSESFVCPSRMMINPLDTVFVEHIVTDRAHTILTCDEVMAYAAVFY